LVAIVPFFKITFGCIHSQLGLTRIQESGAFSLLPLFVSSVSSVVSDPLPIINPIELFQVIVELFMLTFIPCEKITAPSALFFVNEEFFIFTIASFPQYPHPKSAIAPPALALLPINRQLIKLVAFP
jgi:hypothetical protein